MNDEERTTNEDENLADGAGGRTPPLLPNAGLEGCATEKEAIQAVKEWSEQTKQPLDLIMHKEDPGVWRINRTYEDLSIPEGNRFRAFLVAFLSNYVTDSGRWRKYYCCVDCDILAVDTEFPYYGLPIELFWEVRWCLVHTAMLLLPPEIRQSVVELRKIRQSGWALEPQVCYDHGQTDFIHAKNWLLFGAEIPEAIQEAGVDSNLVFRAIEAGLIVGKDVLTVESLDDDKLAKIHELVQGLIDGHGVSDLPDIDVWQTVAFDRQPPSPVHLRLEKEARFRRFLESKVDWGDLL